MSQNAGREAVVPAVLFLFDIILGSRAVGQMSAGPETKTITLGVVAEKNEKEIEAHYQDFVRYLAKKLSSSSKIEGKIVVSFTQSRLATFSRRRR